MESYMKSSGNGMFMFCLIDMTLLPSLELIESSFYVFLNNPSIPACFLKPEMVLMKPLISLLYKLREIALQKTFAFTSLRSVLPKLFVGNPEHGRPSWQNADIQCWYKGKYFHLRWWTSLSSLSFLQISRC